MEILNIELEEKTDSTVRITYRDDTTNLPVDLTSHKAILQIRPQFGSEILIDQVDSDIGSIVLGGQSGTIDLNFTPAFSDQSAVTSGWTRAAYDLIIQDEDGLRKKLLKGFITVSRSATLDGLPL